MATPNKPILAHNTFAFKRALGAFTRLLCLAMWPEEAERLYQADGVYHPEDDEDLIIMVLEEARDVWKPLVALQEEIPPTDRDPSMAEQED
jgi:hypothetical protein